MTLADSIGKKVKSNDFRNKSEHVIEIESVVIFYFFGFFKFGFEFRILNFTDFKPSKNMIFLEEGGGGQPLTIDDLFKSYYLFL